MKKINTSNILAFLSILILLSLPIGCFADYYDGTEGLTGDELKQTLHNIIDDHIEFSYNALRDYILPNTDEDPNNSNNVILLYTGISIPKSEFGGMVDEWNREHVWAKSHGDFGTSPPAGTDAHHIRPTNVYINSMRGNKDFDLGGSPVYTYNGSTLGGYRTDETFEPLDNVKGDVARMIFYMAVRYEGDNGEPDLEMVDYIPSSPNGEPYHARISTLLQWHTDDPVDEWEESRNDKIYENWQENRNPFIDHPEFADLIWNYATIDENYTEKLQIKIFPNPFNISESNYLNISFSTTQQIQNIVISIFNVKGEKIFTMNIQNASSTQHIFNWNGRNGKNRSVTSGVYFIKFQLNDDKHTVRKILLIK
ncbi:MAG: endonuclease [Candidatus Cloacimonadota bacterium]|nr:endonuclease [Candidatus Cloacimonadota bacterium]